LNLQGAEKRRVVVVGGGISGCACAARLAASGVQVTVVSSALDVVGLPGHGPEVWAGPGGLSEITETLDLLPDGLRWAWLNAAGFLESGEPVLVVDRRAVSIESKRALETMPGLGFRQGLVTDVRLRDRGREAALSDSAPNPDTDALAVHRAGSGVETETEVEVETAFGEVFLADAVVLAPGLALRGRVEVGDEILPGGRYGEVPADELCAAMEAFGVVFEEITVAVAPRYAREAPLVEAAFEGSRLNGEGESTLVTRRLLPARELIPGSASANHTWPGEFPPAPHWTESLRPKAAVLSTPSDLVVVAPDGAATAEYYVELQGAVTEGITRLGHVVRALVAVGVDAEGRLPGGPGCIRVAGRSAGAKSYLESLTSGVRVADSLVRSLRGAGEPG
jgi:hypothetical protein